MKKQQNEAEKTGTNEWVKPGNRINSQNGCIHNCGYCFGETFSNRFHKKQTKWNIQEPKAVTIKKSKNLLMYPTCHDFFPLNCTCPQALRIRENTNSEDKGNIFYCYTNALDIIKENLEIGNKLLLVSKPHFKFVEDIIEKFSSYKDQIIFRFTITTVNDMLIESFEKNAPYYGERIACVYAAIKAGFTTTISLEPFLDEYPDELVKNLLHNHPGIQEIWLGAMSQVPSMRFSREQIEHLKVIYNRKNIIRINKVIAEMNNSKIKLKHSFRRKLDNPRRADLQKEIAGPGYIFPGQEGKAYPVKVEEGCIVYFEVIDSKKIIHYVDLPRSRR